MESEPVVVMTVIFVQCGVTADLEALVTTGIEVPVLIVGS